MFDLLMEPVKKKVLQVTDDFGGQSEALTLGTVRESGVTAACYLCACACWTIVHALCICVCTRVCA